MMKILLSIVSFLYFLSSAKGQQTAALPDIRTIDSSFVFHEPPSENCHAATITQLDGDELLAAWFGGSEEGKNDVVIYLSRRMQNQWTTPSIVAVGYTSDGGAAPCWNPVLLKERSGKLYLHYKVGPSPREWWSEMISSDDNGYSWSAPEKLPEGMLGPIKNKAFQLSNGNILYPSSTESLDESVWHVHVEQSDASVKKWKKVIIDNRDFGAIQPSILDHGENKLQLLCRSRQNVIVQSWSYDGGESWTPLEKLNLPNPNAGTDAVSINPNFHLLVYNPLPSGDEWWEGRSVLKLAMSSDGLNWEDVCMLEEHNSGEYSYPAIIKADDGVVHILYTYDRKYIKHVEINFN